MKVRIILVFFVTLGMQLSGSGQEPPLEQFRGKPIRPGWWFTLMQCDLCVVASSIKLYKVQKERLTDSGNKVVAEYFPVEMQIDRILFFSHKMTFDGRFLKDPDNQYKVNPKADPSIKIFYTRIFSGVQGIVDSEFIGDDPKLPEKAIFVLVKSNHKKGGEFLISGWTGIENEAMYVKTIADDLQVEKQ